MREKQTIGDILGRAGQGSFDIPLKRRQITKVSGQFFNTASAGLTIIIGLDPEWEGEEEISY